MKLIEKYEEGIHDLEFFSADFKTGSMMIDNKEYPIGYISCCAANISKEKMDRLVIYGGMMKQCYFRMKYFGYDRKEYREIYAMAKEMLEMMKEYRVFDCFDFDGTLKLLEKCFGEKSLDEYEELIFMKEQISKQKIEKPDDKTVFRMVSIEKKMKMAQMIISAFSYAAVDTANFSTVVQNFVDKIMEKDARQKSELAKTAFEFFSDETMMYFFEQSNPSKNDMKGFSISSRQITVPVVIESDGDFVLLKRVYFERLMDFYVTDLFEGLSAGHYLWKCKVCGRYFLMQSAYKQLYCSEVNPEYGVPCSHIAKHPEITQEKMKKQKKSDSPYYVLWKKRANSIRKNKSLGKYDEVISAKAKKLIDDYFDRTSYDFDYAKTQYMSDMELSKIYEEAVKN